MVQDTCAREDHDEAERLDAEIEEGMNDGNRDDGGGEKRRKQTETGAFRRN